MGKGFFQSFLDSSSSSLDLNDLIQASAIGLAVIIVIAPLISYYNYSRLVQQDLTREAAGLPTEVEITPEEIEQTPDLEEIYGAAADDGFLVFLLQSNEQSLRNEYLANLLLDYIDNHPLADQLWTLYEFIEPILDNIIF